MNVFISAGIESKLSNMAFRSTPVLSSFIATADDIPRCNDSRKGLLRTFPISFSWPRSWLFRFAAAKVGERPGLGKLAPLDAAAEVAGRNAEVSISGAGNGAKGSRSDSAMGGVATALGKELWVVVYAGLGASKDSSST